MSSNNANTTIIFSGWVDVVQTCCGISTGSTTSETGLNIPVIYFDKQNAVNDINDMRREYEEDILQGDKEEDDEYEGELAQVDVLADGTLFFPEFGKTEIAADVCGCSVSQIDVEVMKSFKKDNCIDA